MANRKRTIDEKVGAVQIALGQFEAMAEFNEAISQIAREIEPDITEVEELVAAATSEYLEVLADVWGKVPEQTQSVIEGVMANLMVRHQNRVEGLEQKGAEAPPSPQIPEKIRERVEQRMQEHEQQWSDGTTSPGQGAPVEAWQQNGPGTT